MTIEENPPRPPLYAPTHVNLNPKYPTNLSLYELERKAEEEGNELALRIAQAARDSSPVYELCEALGQANSNVDTFLEALAVIVKDEYWQPSSMVEGLCDRLNLSSEASDDVMRLYLQELRSEYERALKAIWPVTLLVGNEATNVKDALIEAYIKPEECDTMPAFWEHSAEFDNPFESLEERNLRRNPPQVKYKPACKKKKRRPATKKEL